MRKLLLLIVIPLFCLFSTNFAQAATFLTENFNSYNDGDLNGQGDWSGSTEYDVQGTTVFEGAKAGKYSSAGNVDITNTQTSVAAGIIGINTYTDANDGGSFVWRIYDTSNSSYNGAIQISTNGDGEIGLYYESAAYVVISSTADKDTWYRTDIEWADNGGTKQIRARVNGGSWSSWYDAWADWSSGPDQFQISANIVSSANWYFDCISESACEGEEEPPAIIASGMTFPQVLMVILAAFILCFIIDRGGGRLVKAVPDLYRWKL